MNSGLANAGEQRKFSYFSRSNYSTAEATDYRRLDGRWEVYRFFRFYKEILFIGLSAMTWSEDGRYLLVTAGMIAVFPPGIAVAPHIFKIEVDQSNATNFLNIAEFTRVNITGERFRLFRFV